MNNEEIQEKFEQLASAIDWIKTKLVDLQEEKGLAPVKTPYEVEVPDDLENYYFLDETGNIVYKALYSSNYQKKTFIHGLAFKTKEEAERYDRERILLFKLHKWAEEHNRGWTPNWNDLDEEKNSVIYDNRHKKLKTIKNYRSQEIIKLPYFKKEEIAEQFIKEFGEEIKEVLC